MEDKIVNDYYGKVNWTVGGLFAHDKFIYRLVDKCNFMGLPNPIQSVFGSIPCKWQGGRIAPRDTTYKSAVDIISSYNKRNIGVRFTFSSPFITKEDLKDETCNALLSIANKIPNLNGAIISSDILYDYIRDKYPNIKLISSILKPIYECDNYSDTSDYYNELLEKYDIVVVNQDRSDDDKFLSELLNIDKVEFLANHRCRKFCPNARNHYTVQIAIEQYAITHNSAIDEGSKEIKLLRQINTECITHKFNNPTDIAMMSNNQVKNLVDKGFTRFKLEGRDYDSTTLIRDIGYYIFNPDGPYLNVVQSIQEEPV